MLKNILQNKSIRFKASLMIVLGLSLPIFLYNYIVVQIEIQEKIETAHEITQNTTRMLAQSLEKPLWDFDQNTANEIVESFKNFPYYYSIEVLDSNNHFFAASGLKNNPILDGITFEIVKNFIKNNQKIGSLKIKYGFQNLENQKNSVLFFHSLSGFILLVACVLFVNLLLEILIIRPLKKITSEAMKIAENPELKFKNFFTDSEFKTLGKTLELQSQKISELLLDLKNKNQELTHKNSTLEEEIKSRSMQMIQSAKLASLGEMSGGIAHEINNPIAIIIGKAERIIKNINKNELNSEKIKTDLETVLKTTERVVKIIRGLKAFSRTDKKDPMSLVAFSKIIDDSKSLCSEKFKNHGVDLQILTEDFQLYCREVEISQIILNLFNNSYDAIHETENPWIRVTTQKQGTECIQIIITDSGTGIPSEIQNKILDPFFTTKAVGKGTGLGLSLSKGIAEAHNGKLWLNTNSPNTEFILELPLAQASHLAA